MSSSTRKILEFPYEFHELEPDISEQLIRDFPGAKDGFLQVGPDRWLLPKKYKDEAAAFYNFEVRESDVWIVTYPRSGTTWTQEMLWLIANDSDYEKASKIQLVDRFPFLEYHVMVHSEVIEDMKKEHPNLPEMQKELDKLYENVAESLEFQKGRRFIKTHLPFSLLPPDLLKKGCKVVYVARNPLDVAPSFYHLHRTARNFDYTGSFRQFWQYFKQDLICWAPYWKHIQEGWERRNEANLLFLFYEDMIEDLQGTIKITSNFLGKSINNEEIEILENHLKFENFRCNLSVNMANMKDLKLFKRNEENFVRKGKSGGWKSYFDESEVMKVKKWVEENQRAIGIQFKI